LARLDLRAFDYWYYDESTDSDGRTSRSYYRFDCAIVPIGAACPALSIGRETFFTRMAGALSFHDIEFEDDASTGRSTSAGTIASSRTTWWTPG
jgi:hypothetical protein